MKNEFGFGKAKPSPQSDNNTNGCTIVFRNIF